MDLFRSPWLTHAAKAITLFGSSPWTVLLMVGMSWWWRDSRRNLMVFWGSWVMGVLLEVILRLWVGHGRPDAGPIPASADVLTHLQVAGFPSGHAFRSAFVCGWWASSLRHRKPPWPSVAVIGGGMMILLIGLSRVYLLRHWWTDVVGGWVVAAIVLTIARGQTTQEHTK